MAKQDEEQRCRRGFSGGSKESIRRGYRGIIASSKEERTKTDAGLAKNKRGEAGER